MPTILAMTSRPKAPIMRELRSMNLRSSSNAFSCAMMTVLLLCLARWSVLLRRTQDRLVVASHRCARSRGAKQARVLGVATHSRGTRAAALAGCGGRVSRAPRKDSKPYTFCDIIFFALYILLPCPVYGSPSQLSALGRGSQDHSGGTPLTGDFRFFVCVRSLVSPL
jgi:hypothetical protein